MKAGLTGALHPSELRQLYVHHLYDIGIRSVYYLHMMGCIQK
jgi:hypothetical protein